MRAQERAPLFRGEVFQVLAPLQWPHPSLGVIDRQAYPLSPHPAGRVCLPCVLSPSPVFCRERAYNVWPPLGSFPIINNQLITTGSFWSSRQSAHQRRTPASHQTDEGKRPERLSCLINMSQQGNDRTGTRLSLGDSGALGTTGLYSGGGDTGAGGEGRGWVKMTGKGSLLPAPSTALQS